MELNEIRERKKAALKDCNFELASFYRKQEYELIGKQDERASADRIKFMGMLDSFKEIFGEVAYTKLLNLVNNKPPSGYNVDISAIDNIEF